MPKNARQCTSATGTPFPNHAFYLNDILIQNAQEKELSIEIDSQLNFHKQTASAIAKASQMLAVTQMLV